MIGSTSAKPAQRGADDRTRILELARLEIAHIHLARFADLKHAMLTAVHVSARTMPVARVGIWQLVPDRSRLERIVQHDARLPAPDDMGASALDLGGWPAYLGAVLSRRVVAADDAVTDPRTCELRATYLVPNGITSMLDAPLFVGGEVWGIVCHEHAGPQRKWAARELDFAVSVADMLSAMLEQALRLTIEERLRETEGELARIRQAEAVVRTAAAIGHDVNTLLQAILASAQRAINDGSTEQCAASLATVMSDCQRAARVVDQLRDLGRPRTGLGVETDLSFVVVDARSTLTALLGTEHSLKTELAPEARVPASRADVERILLNLVVNAREAMPRGGTVTVTVRKSSADVSLEISDEGQGIAPEQAAHVFDPYFTTKSGRNTGLGLFAVQTIARNTGGTVSLATTAGSGTIVTVSWPASAG